MEAHQPTEREAFLRSIIEQPEDDLRRLVFADWLEERGETERSDFIRVQCELANYFEPHDWNRGGELRRLEKELFDPGKYPLREWFGVVGLECNLFLPNDPTAEYVNRMSFVIRRGFVAEVRCTLADWCGGACERCGGECVTYDPGDFRRTVSTSCPACSGTGRTPGIGESVVAHHPVETVRVTNKAPTETGSGWAWWRHTGLDDTDILPVEVFDRLPDADAVPFAHGERLCFSTREDAFTALSTACLLLARSRGKMKRPDGVLETPHRA